MDGARQVAFRAAIVLEFDGAGAIAVWLDDHLSQFIAKEWNRPAGDGRVPALVPGDLHTEDLVWLHGGGDGGGARGSPAEGGERIGGGVHGGGGGIEGREAVESERVDHEGF